MIGTLTASSLFDRLASWWRRINAIEKGAIEDMLGDVDSATTHEIARVTVTAEQWNEMPEFEGW